MSAAPKIMECSVAATVSLTDATMSATRAIERLRRDRGKMLRARGSFAAAMAILEEAPSINLPVVANESPASRARRLRVEIDQLDAAIADAVDLEETARARRLRAQANKLRAELAGLL